MVVCLNRVVPFVSALCDLIVLNGYSLSNLNTPMKWSFDNCHQIFGHLSPSVPLSPTQKLVPPYSPLLTQAPDDPLQIYQGLPWSISIVVYTFLRIFWSSVIKLWKLSFYSVTKVMNYWLLFEVKRVGVNLKNHEYKEEVTTKLRVTKISKLYFVRLKLRNRRHIPKSFLWVSGRRGRCVKDDAISDFFFTYLFTEKYFQPNHWSPWIDWLHGIQKSLLAPPEGKTSQPFGQGCSYYGYAKPLSLLRKQF